MTYRNKLRFSVTALLLALALFGNLSVTSAQQATFTTGTVYSSSVNFLSGAGGIGVVPSAGGTVSNTFSTSLLTPQVAWSPDLTSAYATTNGGSGAVLKLTPDGTVTTFATLPQDAFAIGTHPDGRVLAALLNQATVYDISAGGAGPFPVYTTVPNFGGDQNYAMLRTSAGRLLISGSYQKIYDITDPANVTVAADASGLPGPQGHFYDMAEGPSGEIYAWSADGLAVIKVTGGVASIFATLPFFQGGNSVTYGYGKLLVGGVIFSPPFTRVIYDISAGGNFSTPPAPFATHGDFSLSIQILDTVPAIYPPSPQDQIAALIVQVQALVTAGVLTQDQGTGLIDKLQQTLNALNGGHTNAACNQLGAFINQVHAFINNGSLTAAQGQALIDAANTIKTTIGC
jgi:hypothetical protein